MDHWFTRSLDPFHLDPSNPGGKQDPTPVFGPVIRHLEEYSNSSFSNVQSITAYPAKLQTGHNPRLHDNQVSDERNHAKRSNHNESLLKYVELR
jgi:hypothetical protein